MLFPLFRYSTIPWSLGTKLDFFKNWQLQSAYCSHFQHLFGWIKFRATFCLISAVILLSQGKSNAQVIDFCGEVTSNTAISSDPDSICFDRFGNTYDISALQADFQSSSRSRSIVGYFDLSMNLDPEMEAVIEDVFEYLTTVINQRTNTTGCEDVIASSRVRILITEATLSGPTVAAATPMYYVLGRFNCDEVAINRVDLRMNGGINDRNVDGSIEIDATPGFDWYTGSGSPGVNELDLFSVVLHEVLHLFGFASLINEEGEANSGFYSVWDQYLHTTTLYVDGGPSLNIDPVLESNCEINCWELNNEVFEDAEEFVGAIEDNCSTGSAIDFVFGENAIAPLFGISTNVGAALSHLNATCNGQDEEYVMGPGIGTGESRRVISNPEFDILCQLGYVVDGYCDLCYLTVLTEDINISSFESCCSSYFDACVGVQKEISFDDLLCNDFSDGTVTITDYWLNFGSGLSVTTNTNGFLVTASLQGIKRLHYTVKGCDCRLLNGFVTIYVGPCTDCEEINPCENLVCVEDFEEFEPGVGLYNMHYQACGNVWFTETGGNSIDVCEDGTGNNYLDIGSTSSNREGFCMKLSDPVGPGCKLTIEFDASARKISGFDWYVSVDPPCDYQDANVFSNGDPVNCGSYTFEPFFIGQTKVSNSAGVVEHICVDDPNLQPYTHEWINNISIEANYLVLFPTQSSLSFPVNYIDNIIVTKECLDPSFSFTQDTEECLEVHFTSEGDETIDHSWNFGDSNTSTLEDPEHEYSSDGNYTVTHTVTDECGNSSSETHTVTLAGCCQDYVVTTNTVWLPNTPLPNNGIFHTLTIQEGVSLNIVTGVVLKFCPGGSMVVEAGAHVRNKGTLTSLGSINWEGVFLEGNPTYSQFSSFSLYPWAHGFIPQGYFYADQNSLIENATIGLRNYGPGVNNTHGGMIKAIGAKFKNNGIGVDFRPYRNFRGDNQVDDLSAFTECIFTNTSSYTNSHPFSAFVQMNGVNGIEFYGCKFTNEYIPSLALEYEDFGRGISAVSSGFKVLATNPPLPCLPPNDCGQFCTFNGLGHGIYASEGTEGIRPYKIWQAEFENCWRGITSDGASGGTILFNEFHFGATPATFSIDDEDQIGIQLQDAHAGFEIQENSFIYDEEGVTNAIGFRIEGIGIAPNVIRRNTFLGLDIPHEAYRRNALNTEVNSSGLRFLCEEMDGTDDENGVDIWIPETGVIDNIYIVQAEFIDASPNYRAAGNLFSDPGFDIQNDNDFINNLEERVYYIWYDDTRQEPISGVGYSKDESSEENHCPVEYSIHPVIGSGDLTEEKDRHYSAIAARTANIEDYNTAIEEEEYETAEDKKKLIEENTFVAFQSAYNLMQYFWHDTVYFSHDTLMKWYERMDYYAADILAAGEIAKKDGYGDAVNFLNDIPLNRDLLPEEEIDLNKIIYIYSMLDTSDMYALSNSQRNGLRSIAQSSTGTSSVMARAILSFYKEKFPLRYYLLEVTRPSVAYRSEDSISLGMRPLYNLEALPIPADDYVTLKWDAPIDNDATWLSLLDCVGRELITVRLAKGQVEQTLDIAHLGPGLYFASVIGSNRRYEARKILKR